MDWSLLWRLYRLGSLLLLLLLLLLLVLVLLLDFRLELCYHDKSILVISSDGLLFYGLKPL